MLSSEVTPPTHRDRGGDHDDRDPGRLVLMNAQPGDIDLFRLEGRSRLVPESIVADRAHEQGRDAETGRRDRLIGALAAVMPGVGPAGDGLARLGQPPGSDHEVDVDRADDDDPSGHGTLNVMTPSTANHRLLSERRGDAPASHRREDSTPLLAIGARIRRPC